MTARDALILSQHRAGLSLRAMGKRKARLVRPGLSSLAAAFRMRLSAVLRTLTCGFGRFSTGSDEECTPSSRPSRNLPLVTCSAKSGAGLQPSRVTLGVCRKSATRDDPVTAECPVVIRRAWIEQGDGRLQAPYGILSRDVLNLQGWDALGFSPPESQHSKS